METYLSNLDEVSQHFRPRLEGLMVQDLFLYPEVDLTEQKCVALKKICVYHIDILKMFNKCCLSQNYLCMQKFPQH